MLLNAVVKYPTNTLLIAPLDEKRLCFVMKKKGVVKKWRELGTQLLDENNLHYLDEIEVDHPKNVRGCCNKMFEQWLITKLDASWDQLCNALVTIDLPVAATEIKQELSRGVYVFILCTYQCKAPLPYILAAVGERWGMVGESTTNLPPGSEDLSLYINLLN